MSRPEAFFRVAPRSGRWPGLLAATAKPLPPPRSERRSIAHHPGPRPGDLNLALAWWLMGAGLIAGAILGFWAFDVPFPGPIPGWRFDDSARRLVRLAHIALVALPAINLLYVPWLRRSFWSDRAREMAARALLGGTIGLPVCLAAAALWRPALYVAPLPVTCVIGAVIFLALGLSLDTRRIL